MKMSLHYCLLVTVLHGACITAEGDPNLEGAPVRVLILKETKPEVVIFFDSFIRERLEYYYSQNGCKSMSEMTHCHGDDTCLRIFQCACLEALTEYWRNETKKQASQAIEFCCW